MPTPRIVVVTTPENSIQEQHSTVDYHLRHHDGNILADMRASGEGSTTHEPPVPDQTVSFDQNAGRNVTTHKNTVPEYTSSLFNRTCTDSKKKGSATTLESRTPRSATTTDTADDEEAEMALDHPLPANEATPGTSNALPRQQVHAERRESSRPQNMNIRGLNGGGLVALHDDQHDHHQQQQFSLLRQDAASPNGNSRNVIMASLRSPGHGNTNGKKLFFEQSHLSQNSNVHAVSFPFVYQQPLQFFIMPAVPIMPEQVAMMPPPSMHPPHCRPMKNMFNPMSFCLQQANKNNFAPHQGIGWNLLNSAAVTAAASKSKFSTNPSFNLFPSTFLQQGLIIPTVSDSNGQQSSNNNTNSKTGTSQGGKTANQQSDEVEKPCRPLTAYNLFFSEEHEIVLAEVKAALDKKRQSEPAGDREGSKTPSPEEIEEILKSPELGLPEAELNDLKEKLALKTQHLLTTRLEGKKGKKPPHRRTHGWGVHSLSKAIGKRWRKLKTNRREHYENLARIDVVRYNKEMNEYEMKVRKIKHLNPPVHIDPALSDERPRRPLNAYNFFFSEEREVILTELRFAIASKMQGQQGEEEETLSISSDIENQELEEIPDPEEVEKILNSPPVLPEAKLKNLRQKLDAKSQQVLNTHKEIEKEKKAHRRPHGIGFRPLSKAIAARWKNLGLERREHYKNLAKKDLDRYNDAMDAFNKKLNSKKEK